MTRQPSIVLVSLAMAILTGCGADSKQESDAHSPASVSGQARTSEEETAKRRSGAGDAPDTVKATDTREKLIADCLAFQEEMVELVSGIEDEAEADQVAKKIRAMRPRWLEFQERQQALGIDTHEEVAQFQAALRERSPTNLVPIVEEYKQTNEAIFRKVDGAVFWMATGIEPSRPVDEVEGADQSGGEKIWSFQIGGLGQEVISPDGRWIVTVTSEEADFRGIEPRQFRLWDTSTGETKHEWEASFDPQALAISSDGKTLVSAGVSNEQDVVRAWDLPEGKQRFSTPLEEGAAYGNLSISADGSRSYLMSGGPGYYAVELDTGKTIKLLEGGWGKVYVTPHSGLVVDPDHDGLKVYGSPEEFAAQKEPIAEFLDMHSTDLIACSGDGHFVAACYMKPTDDGRVQMLSVVDLASSEELLHMSCGFPPETEYHQLIISHNGRYVAIAEPHYSEKHRPYLFDVQAKQRKPLDEMGANESLQAFTPAGVLITWRRGMYRFFDPQTQSRIKPPLTAKHFQTQL